MSYIDLITSQYSNSTKFIALVDYLTGVIESNNSLLKSTIFDLETSTGFELDYIAEWIGFNRNLSSPITGTLFSFDDFGLGFDRGYWQEQYSPTGILRLPDDLFRQLLKAKIYANHYDGTIEGAQISLQKIFPDNDVIIQDNQDMTMTVGLLRPVDAVTQAIIDAGYLSIIKPAGVQLNYLTSSVFFAFDFNTSTEKGFDLGFFS